MISRPEQIVLIKIRLIKIRSVRKFNHAGFDPFEIKTRIYVRPKSAGKLQKTNFKINFISVRSDTLGEICALEARFTALRRRAFDLRARGELNLRGEILKF